MEVSDEKIIIEIRAGGLKRESATDMLMRKYIKYVSSIQKKYHVEEEQAIDLFTDAIIGLIMRIEQNKFRGESKLSTYFYRIFVNKTIDHLRKKNVNIVQIEDQEFSNFSQERPQSEEWFDKMKFENLKQTMKKIGEPCYQILMDWGFWGYSMEEIGSRLDIGSKDQVKKKKYTCLKKLRKIISSK